MPFLPTFLYSQIFVTPQLPDHDFSDQTVIITGSNTGLGLETAKHFLRLHCGKLIIAVRNISKGESAKKTLLDANQDISPAQIEVWHVNLLSSDSVRAFADRASSELQRIDVLVANAGILTPSFTLSADGWESALQTNVISTCLMGLLMLPKLRETGERFGTTPHLVVVTSDIHYMARFAERDAPEGILKALNKEEKFNKSDRYSTTKLLEILFFRELSRRLKASPDGNSSGNPHAPIITLPTPGLSVSEIWHDCMPPRQPLLHPLETLAYLFERTLVAVLARTGEVGARTLVTAACAGRDADGQFMMDGQVRAVAEWVETEEGRRVQRRVYDELCEVIGRKDDLTTC